MVDRRRRARPDRMTRSLLYINWTSLKVKPWPIASACRREWSEWKYRNRGEGICTWVVRRGGVTDLCAPAAGHWPIITPEGRGSFAIHHLSPHMSPILLVPSLPGDVRSGFTGLCHPRRGTRTPKIRLKAGSPVHGRERLKERLVLLAAFRADRQVMRDGLQAGRDRPAGELPLGEFGDPARHRSQSISSSLVRPMSRNSSAISSLESDMVDSLTRRTRCRRPRP